MGGKLYLSSLPGKVKVEGAALGSGDLGSSLGYTISQLALGWSQVPISQWELGGFEA